MTRRLIVIALVFAPALAAAQTAPTVTTGKTAVALRAAQVDVAVSKPDGGGAGSATAAAQNTLNTLKKFCAFHVRESKYVASCDDTTAAARASALNSSRPDDWGNLAKKISDADATVHGKRRDVVVLNRGELMAEITTGNVLRLKR